MKLFFIIYLSFFCFAGIYSQELKEGSLVKPIDDDRIYLVFNRELYHIPNMEVFNNLFIENPQIEELPLINFEILPKAGILYNARIIKGENSAIFLQYYDFKQHIANTETFDALQFD
jgi:hypothetical protein